MSEDLTQQLIEVNEKLDRVVRLLALSAISPDQSMKDKAIQLSSVGLAPKEIASLLGTTPNTISVALSAAKRSKKKRLKKSK